MKTKNVLTMLAAIALLAQLPILVLSQNNNSMPDAAACFSTFSLPQNLGGAVNSADDEQGKFFRWAENGN